MVEQIVSLAELAIDGKGSYGIGASAVPYSKDLYTYLRITDIKDDGTLNLQDMKSVNDKKAQDYLLKPNDIVFARTGASTGRNYLYDESDGEFVYAGFLIKFSIDESKVNPKYIKYYCQSKQYKDWVNSVSTGSTRGNINAQTFGKMPIPLINRNQQDNLVSIISSIEDRIKQNVEINNNLYQQLDAIYRATYPYLPSDELPVGWNSVPLGMLCDSISIKHSFDKEKLIFLNTGDIENGHFLHSTYSPVKDMPGQAKKSIKTNDILYSEIRPINRHFAFVNFQANDYVVSTKLMVIRSREIDSRRLYHFLTTQDVINELQIEAESRSGTFPQIRFENIQRLPIIIAPPDIELQFTQTLKDYYNMIDSNIRENQHLLTLRDSILPKLMSGEIDVSAIKL